MGITSSGITGGSQETTTSAGNLIFSATEKNPPVDADYLGLMDSAASNILKKLSLANLKAYTSASPTLVTPVLGVASATSVAAASTVLGVYSSGAALSSLYAYLSAGTITDIATISGSYTTTLNHALTSNNAIAMAGYRANNTLNQGAFNATSSAALLGYWADPRATGASGTVTGIIGFYSNPQNTGAGTVTTAVCYEAFAVTNSGGGAVTTAVGFKCRNFSAGTTAYAAQLSMTAAANRWNIYVDGTAVNYINGNLQIGSTTATAGAEKLQVTGTASISSDALINGNLAVGTAGKGLQIKEGSNAKMGTSTLVAGTVTVSTTAVTATSRIYLTVQSLGTVAVATPVAVTARTAATSFVITSSAPTDTSVIAWMLVEPA